MDIRKKLSSRYRWFVVAVFFAFAMIAPVLDRARSSGIHTSARRAADSESITLPGSKWPANSGLARPVRRPRGFNRRHTNSLRKDAP